MTAQILGALALFVFVCSGCGHSSEEKLTGEGAMSRFYSQQGAEDQLMDPLIVAGSVVVPLLVEAVADPAMPRRRYAIGALGNIGDEAAIPVLGSIAVDPREIDYYRCDALNAIGLIDYAKARELAAKYRESPVGCLSRLAGQLLAKDEAEFIEGNYMRRTVDEAGSGRHM